MGQGAYILGCEGLSLSKAERRFFAEADPWGFILFARNVDTPAQLDRLTDELRDCVGRAAPVLVDQEGGRVARMRGPHWQEFLPALHQIERAGPEGAGRSMWLRARLIAADLLGVGIDVNCAPLADLVRMETHPVLHNRLYGGDVDTVVDLCRAVSAGTLAGGVLPVLKHLPGYGRATVDSHKDLPRVATPLDVLEDHDFAPFRALTDTPMGMTAHIVVDALDPDAPATTSAPAMRYIREEIGFDALLMTDDISMEALSGSIAARSRAALDAGCDIVLHCNGEMEEMAALVDVSGPLTEEGQARADRALAARQAPEPLDITAAREELRRLLSLEAG
jgi:beta-N-acetylhexosaminidase